MSHFSTSLTIILVFIGFSTLTPAPRPCREAGLHCTGGERARRRTPPSGRHSCTLGTFRCWTCPRGWLDHPGPRAGNGGTWASTGARTPERTAARGALWLGATVVTTRPCISEDRSNGLNHLQSEKASRLEQVCILVHDQNGLSQLICNLNTIILIM